MAAPAETEDQRLARVLRESEQSVAASTKNLNASAEVRDEIARQRAEAERVAASGRLPGLAPTAGERRVEAAGMRDSTDTAAAERAYYTARNAQTPDAESSVLGSTLGPLAESAAAGVAKPFKFVADLVVPPAVRAGFGALAPGGLAQGGGAARMEAPPAESDSGIAGRDKGAPVDDWYSQLGREQPGGAGVGSLFGGTEAYAAQVKGPEYKMSQILSDAYGTQTGGYKPVEEKLQQFQESPERARILSDAEAAKKKYADEEQDRFKRAEGISARAQGMEAEAKRIAGLKIDPEAMMGRGVDRARTTLGLSIANVLGNIGQAMQGKAATDAVLGVVRDMIAQNIGIQQQDRQYELQGFQARQTALGRTAEYLKDEGLAAKAVLSGQLGWHEAELERISRGLRDAEARNVVTQAIGKIAESKGNVDQQLMNATTAGKFQADMANAQMATSAAIQRATARVAKATAEATAMGQGLSEGDSRLLAESVFKPAREAKLGQRYEILKEIQDFAKDPENQAALKSASGWIATFRKGVGKDMDAGAIRTYMANLGAEQFTDSKERQFFDLLRQYEAAKMGGQAGKAITGFEAYIYSPNQVFDSTSLQRMVADEHRYNIAEKRGLATTLTAMNSPAQRVGKTTLDNLYPDMLQPAPSAQAQPGPMRTPAR